MTEVACTILFATIKGFVFCKTGKLNSNISIYLHIVQWRSKIHILQLTNLHLKLALVFLLGTRLAMNFFLPASQILDWNDVNQIGTSANDRAYPVVSPCAIVTASLELASNVLAWQELLDWVACVSVLGFHSQAQTVVSKFPNRKFQLFYADLMHRSTSFDSSFAICLVRRWAVIGCLSKENVSKQVWWILQIFLCVCYVFYENVKLVGCGFVWQEYLIICLSKLKVTQGTMAT